METRIRIAVLFGGRSGEHAISLVSAQSVLSVLDPQKYEIYQVGISEEGKWLTGPNARDMMEKGDLNGLSECSLFPDPSRPGLYGLRKRNDDCSLNLITPLDVVFPVLHGTFGEDGTVQGLLELNDVAYVGAGVTGSSVGMDKGVFKDVMRANDIPTVESIIVLRSELEKDMSKVMQRCEQVAGYPLFIKPANLGSSVGISKCNNRSDLGEGLKEAAAYDRRILVERGVDGHEIEVSVLGNDEPQASVPGEVLPSREFYSYESKYIDGTSSLLIPAPLAENITRKIRELAVRAYAAIDCAGMARVDFFVERSTNNIYLNEINTIPGFTSISMYPKLWEASGMPYAKLVDRLIELALDRKADRDHTERRFRRSK